MKTNKTRIEGDNNTSFTDVNRSKIQVGVNSDQKGAGKNWTIIGVVVAILSLIAAIVIGWDQIQTFLK
ncbi:hypothetical protein GCM10027578_35620 [Spirosoma luteolum]